MRRRPSLFWRILLGLLLLALLFPTTSPLISFGNTPTAPNASTTEASGHPMIFEDVEESDYFYDAVRWAVEHGITEGTSDTTFAPKDYCSRGQVITFLWKAMGSPEPQSSSHPFTDIPEDAYYTKAVLWAAEQNIASGTSESTFSPNAPCARAQVMTFLWKLKGQPAATSSAGSFPDVTTADYFYAPVMWAAKEKITTGLIDSRFGAMDQCNRAQVVTLLWHALGKQ